jgi:hypothetical protein
MLVLRAVVGAAVVAASVASLAAASAGVSDTCAQRVIRDWYAEGRVDRVYPLRCYRAAVAMLPEDVVQYSNARDKILRALAYAREGLAPQHDGDGSTTTASTPEATPQTRSDGEPAPPTGTPTRAAPAPADTAAVPPREADVPVQLAGAADVEAADAGGLPYPILGLATLAALLLAAAAAARLGARRRARDDVSDR